MSAMHRMTIAGLLVFCTLAGAAAGYFVAARQDKLEQLNQFYSINAAEARANATALSHLRSEGAENGIKVLETQLSIALITLGTYEENVQAKDRLNQVYGDIARVREYYRRFPDARPSPYAADGLELGAAPHAP